MRYRILAAALIFAAALGGKTVAAATDARPAAIAANLTTAQSPSSTPTSAPWEIAGRIQQMNGEFWEIQGFAVRVTPETAVTGDVPSVGVYARARGTVASDGTWLATQVWVGRAATATPEPSPTSTATPRPSPTATALPTSTATPVPTRSAPAVAAPVAPVVQSRGGDDGDEDSDSEKRDEGKNHRESNRGHEKSKHESHGRPGKHD